MRAVFVDGASFSWMRKPLGIGRYDLSKLYSVLAEQIGYPGLKLWKWPVYTLTPEGQAVGKILRTLGFDVILSEYPNHDDQTIISQIKALDPAVVKEIVLVSADQDFVDCVREKAQQGVKVYWTATIFMANGETPMMSRVLLDFIEKTDNVTFVELGQFKGKLMREPWEERMPRIQAHEIVAVELPRPIKITLSTLATRDEIADLLYEVTQVIIKFPDLKYTIEG